MGQLSLEQRERIAAHLQHIESSLAAGNYSTSGTHVCEEIKALNEAFAALLADHDAAIALLRRCQHTIEPGTYADSTEVLQDIEALLAEVTPC